MAYSADVTVTLIAPDTFEVTIEETDAGTADEAEIPGLPIVGTVKRVQCSLESGSGSTIQPLLGRTTSPSSGSPTDYVVEPISNPADAAASVDRCGGATYRATTLASGLGTLWHQSRVDAGADNVITTIYHIKAGW